MIEGPVQKLSRLMRDLGEIDLELASIPDELAWARMGLHPQHEVCVEWAAERQVLYAKQRKINEEIELMDRLMAATPGETGQA